MYVAELKEIIIGQIYDNLTPFGSVGRVIIQKMSWLIIWISFEYYTSVFIFVFVSSPLIILLYVASI